ALAEWKALLTYDQLHRLILPSGSAPGPGGPPRAVKTSRRLSITRLRPRAVTRPTSSPSATTRRGVPVTGRRRAACLAVRLGGKRWRGSRGRRTLWTVVWGHSSRATWRISLRPTTPRGTAPSITGKTSWLDRVRYRSTK